MSRTRKDLTSSAFERKHGIRPWWDHPDALSFYTISRRPGYRPPTPRSRSKRRQHLLRKYWGGVRTRVRMDLLAGREPEPTRHLHSVRWDID